MRVLILTALLGLPLMALGQTTEPQQGQQQTKEPETTAPTKGKTRPEQEETKPQAKPETGQTNVQSRGRDEERNEPRTRSNTNETNVRNTNQTTTVNKEEFRSRHSEVFNLGRHPKEFFVQRFGENHVRQIGDAFFVFVDGCWVAVDVDGFVFSQHVICAGDPGFIEVD